MDTRTDRLKMECLRLQIAGKGIKKSIYMVSTISNTPSFQWHISQNTVYMHRNFEASVISHCGLEIFVQ